MREGVVFRSFVVFFFICFFLQKPAHALAFFFFRPPPLLSSGVCRDSREADVAAAALVLTRLVLCGVGNVEWCQPPPRRCLQPSRERSSKHRRGAARYGIACFSSGVVADTFRSSTRPSALPPRKRSAAPGSNPNLDRDGHSKHHAIHVQHTTAAGVFLGAAISLGSSAFPEGLLAACLALSAGATFHLASGTVLGAVLAIPAERPKQGLLEVAALGAGAAGVVAVGLAESWAGIGH